MVWEETKPKGYENSPQRSRTVICEERMENLCLKCGKKRIIWKCFSNPRAGQSHPGTSGWRMRAWIVWVQHVDLQWGNLGGKDGEVGMENLGCRTSIRRRLGRCIPMGKADSCSASVYLSPWEGRWCQETKP